MLPRHHPDRIQIAFDDHRLVASAGLILPATLALRLGRPQLVDQHLDLGDAPGRAKPGDKMMTLVASALAGGDCIDAAAALRTGRTACALGSVVKAPSTPRHLALPNVRRLSQGLPAANEDRHRHPLPEIGLRPSPPLAPHRPFHCCNVIPSVDSGLV